MVTVKFKAIYRAWSKNQVRPSRVYVYMYIQLETNLRSKNILKSFNNDIINTYFVRRVKQELSIK